VAALATGTTYGVAKQATIIPVRVYGCDNSGPVSNVIAGINYVIGRARASGRRSVVNMSFGGDRIPALDNAVRALVNAGIVVAAAAGNEAQDACNTSPGGSPAAISVGASDRNDRYASFSNFGSCVDIVAPGVNIKSAWIGSPDATETISGTSMATPIVTGVAALVLEANSGASPQDVAGVLTCSATSDALKNIPTSSTPDKLLFSPPQGFVSGCDTSAAFTDIPQVFKGGLVTALTGIAVAATMVVAWRI
jgi:subtilisin family serine protease